MAPTVAIVANEPSGDLLGAALIRALRAQRPGLRCLGVAGPRMLEAGCETLIEMERLSVMGLTEVLGHLPELLRIRRDLARRFLAERPAVFIGIDAPDFNLGLERRVRAAGIATAHLVSPTVWAWRPGRVKQIRASVDRMLCLFPFETEFLERHGVPARYVGHPLADEIPLRVDRAAARARLGLPGESPIIALLPGSRRGEVERLAAPFLAAARWCHERRPELHFVVPLVSERLRRLVEEAARCEAPDLPLTLVDGRSREVLGACDLVLTASGTATLEALLLKRAMVVAYRVHPLTYQLVKQLRLIRVPHIAMANLLAGEALAPEFIQGECRPERLGPALLGFLDDPARVAAIQARYARIHADLRHDAAAAAARAVLELIDERGARC
ncbi:lipid-A-disaccharide synthase [Thiococcus pfennigii]|uniref:lipid-A-disaccharide synthase n=1 Tax=Thiococcus pfennigii TaxID=1057 RepID=UPI00190309E6|nr:lipid-A-disaccharide synthase [Thiococcus pfennigii]MBK1701817.1 lipid-A-disaccharide synthase [Thiococcus pfennigii]MBK1730429.1 lipid-A-disaccharide synthase [Thiococcus pfennigii]